MSEKCNRPGLVFWVAAAVVIVAAYPLSFGPSCWLTSRLDEPHPVFEALYRPLGWMANRTMPQSWDMLYPFAVWGMPDSGSLFLRGGSHDVPTLIMPWDRQPPFCGQPDASE